MLTLYRVSHSVLLSVTIFGLSCNYGDLPQSPCGLVCPEPGITELNSAISGIPSIDAFFSTVVDLVAASGFVNTNVRDALDALGSSVGLPRGTDGAAIASAFQQKINKATDGGLRLKYQPIVCSTSALVASSAAAACDDDKALGSVEVRCDGSCVIDSSLQSECTLVGGDLSCVGVAQSLKCAGECQGICALSMAGACAGTCRGECLGTCSVVNSQGECAGECSGSCIGECHLNAGNLCGGECQGICTYEPLSVCPANTVARCSTTADTRIECSGTCDGDSRVANLAEHCEATVLAKVRASMMCFAPQVELTWQWNSSIEGDYETEALFRAWINNARSPLGELLAATAKAKLLREVASLLADATKEEIETNFATLSASGSTKMLVGATCAHEELEDVRTLLSRVGQELATSTTHADEVLDTLISL